MAVDAGVIPTDLIEIIDAVERPTHSSATPESVSLEISPSLVVACVAVLCLLVTVLVGFQGSGVERSSPVVPTTVGTGELSRSQPSGRFKPDDALIVGGEPNEGKVEVGWPDPPADHSPSYVGRPGSGLPVRRHLANKTLLYVNVSGRPTIVNLTTGGQQEVLIADTRSSDTFNLEFGRIVTIDPLSSDLPQSEGRSIVIAGLRGGFVEKPEASVTLCLDVSGCAPGNLTAGEVAFVGDSVSAMTRSLGASDGIARLVLASEWTTEHRWTIFSMNPEDPEDLFRIPTPRNDAIVWIIEQTP